MRKLRDIAKREKNRNQKISLCKLKQSEAVASCPCVERRVLNVGSPGNLELLLEIKKLVTEKKLFFRQSKQRSYLVENIG